MANHNRDWYLERKKGTSSLEVGVIRFQFVVDTCFHFMGVVSSVDFSATESGLPRVDIRYYMDSSNCHRVDGITRNDQTFRLVSQRGT